jgi:hypothetical protein
MHTRTENGNQTAKDTSRDTRAPWQQPTLKCLGAQGAETGVNSTTDATVTFS